MAAWRISTRAHCGFGFPLSSTRGLSTTSLLSSSDVTPAVLSQPIIISDTPSPAVSIITIHSDTDTEDERKFHPARSEPDPCSPGLNVGG